MGEQSEIPKFLQMKPKTKRRSSFFGFEPCPVEAVNEKEEQEAYFKKLEKERTDWAETFKKFHNNIRVYWQKEKVAVYDKSCLSNERQIYLEKAIDMEKYLKESDEFIKRVDLYVAQKQWLNERYESKIESVEDLIVEKTYDII